MAHDLQCVLALVAAWISAAQTPHYLCMQFEQKDSQLRLTRACHACAVQVSVTSHRVAGNAVTCDALARVMHNANQWPVRIFGLSLWALRLHLLMHHPRARLCKQLFICHAMMVDMNISYMT
jgi:hypothetical protein